MICIFKKMSPAFMDVSVHEGLASHQEGPVSSCEGVEGRQRHTAFPSQHVRGSVCDKAVTW